MNNAFDFIKNSPGGNFDPNNPADREKINQMFSGMNQKDTEKVMQILNNPAETQRILQSPAAQKLLKMLGGDKNG